MRRPPKPEAISRGFLDACLGELDALKPGNVHRLAAGHNMTVEDFVASAEAAALSIGEKRLAVGERIRRAVEATRATVGQNTNLGIVLLAAPLANAALLRGGDDLQSRLRLQAMPSCHHNSCAWSKSNLISQVCEQRSAPQSYSGRLEASQSAQMQDRLSRN